MKRTKNQPTNPPLIPKFSRKTSAKRKIKKTTETKCLRPFKKAKKQQHI